MFLVKDPDSIKMKHFYTSILFFSFSVFESIQTNYLNVLYKCSLLKQKFWIRSILELTQ